MRTINLDDADSDLRTRPLTLRVRSRSSCHAEGQEFLLAEADDFEEEVEAFRKSVSFQQFLDKRFSIAAPVRAG